MTTQADRGASLLGPRPSRPLFEGMKSGRDGRGPRGPARSPTPPARLIPLFVLLALVVPVFAHGCHGGDHDDEPAFVPPVRHQQPR